MHDAIRDRFLHDAAQARSPSGNVNVPGLLHAWAQDTTWRAELLQCSEDARDTQLERLAHHVYDENVGRWAEELRHTTRTLDAYWARSVRDEVLRRHTAVLFVSAFDHTLWSAPAPPGGVTLRGLDYLSGALDSGRGALLLGVNHGHPGPLLRHPALADVEVGIMQHREGPSKTVPLGPRRWLLPADRAGLRHASTLR